MIAEFLTFKNLSSRLRVSQLRLFENDLQMQVIVVAVFSTSSCVTAVCCDSAAVLMQLRKRGGILLIEEGDLE